MSEIAEGKMQPVSHKYFVLKGTMLHHDDAFIHFSSSQSWSGCFISLPVIASVRNLSHSQNSHEPQRRWLWHAPQQCWHFILRLKIPLQLLHKTTKQKNGSRCTESLKDHSWSCWQSSTFSVLLSAAVLCIYWNNHVWMDWPREAWCLWFRTNHFGKAVG